MKSKIYKNISSIHQFSWQLLEDPNFPFADYYFLDTLEKSNCLGSQSGWYPRYITLWDEETLAGAAYLYLKENSHGEFIFDYEWAHAYLRYGMPYYPKLTAAVPFTPATGTKLLVNPNYSKETVQNLLIEETLKFAQENRLSSVHFLFIPTEEINILKKHHFHIRYSYQFHWENNHYQTYEDFLGTLKRKRRQQFVKERRSLQQSGLIFESISGDAIHKNHLEIMYQFYQQTINNKFSQSYLTKKFFTDILCQREHILLHFARNSDKYIAGSINFYKGKNIFGRYWGCLEEYPFLHFELCYYRNIDFAIEHKLQHFEAGAQGYHKMLRGLAPAITYSAHWFSEPAFHRAIGNFISDERESLTKSLLEAEKHSPYKP